MFSASEVKLNKCSNLCQTILFHLSKTCLCVCQSICIYYFEIYYNFTFDWDDQLGYNWKDFVSSMLQHIMNTLSGKELVRMLGFAETVEEKW